MPRQDDDWVERLTRWGAFLGMNPVRVRWRLQRLASDLQREPTDAARPNARPKPRPGLPTLLSRLGFSLPRISLSLFLGLLITLCYARLLRASPEIGLESLFTMDNKVLSIHGAWWPSALARGHWWRLFTAMFVHIGVWHATFNLLALASIGPDIEDMYGAGVMLFAFILTGLLGNLVSVCFNPSGGAGASGALLGLLGLAAIRGHLSRTQAGRAVRERMISWFAYTMIFGVAVGADNWAHAGGFVGGVLFGFVLPPKLFHRGGGRVFGGLLGLVGLVFTVGAVALVMSPELGEALPRWWPEWWQL